MLLFLGVLQLLLNIAIQTLLCDSLALASNLACLNDIRDQSDRILTQFFSLTQFLSFPCHSPYLQMISLMLPCPRLQMILMLSTGCLLAVEGVLYWKISAGHSQLPCSGVWWLLLFRKPCRCGRTHSSHSLANMWANIQLMRVTSTEFVWLLLDQKLFGS